jgi:hypothetical protein
MSESRKATVKNPPYVLSPEARHERELSLFFIGLEILGEKKKQRFLLYLASLQTHTEQNQETKTDEL